MNGIYFLVNYIDPSPPDNSSIPNNAVPIIPTNLPDKTTQTLSQDKAT